MIAIVQLQKHIGSFCIYGIIIYTLDNEKKLCLAILLLIYKNKGVYFNYTILFLCLPIGLRMKSCEKLWLDTKKLIKQKLEL